MEKKLKVIQEDREHERKRYLDNENQLKEKIKNLMTISKEKDQKLARLQKSFMEVKNDILNEKKMLDDGGEFDDMEAVAARLKKGPVSSDSLLETELQKALMTIQKRTKELRDCQNELKKLKEDGKFMKTMSKR